MPNGITTRFTYDIRDRIRSIEHRDANGSVLVSLAYQRAPTDEPTRITRQDGSVVELTYTPTLAVASEKHFSSAGIQLSETLYSYDADGNRTQQTTNGATDSYNYSPGFALASVTTPSGTESYSTDANGRTTTINRDGHSLALTYTSTDRTRSVSIDGQTTTFIHDAQGHRVGVNDSARSRAFLITPNLGDGPASPHLALDANANANNEVLAGYVYSGSQPLLRYTPTEVQYYLEDAMGSVIATADSGGALTGRFAYDSFGASIASGSGEATSPCPPTPRAFITPGRVNTIRASVDSCPATKPRATISPPSPGTPINLPTPTPTSTATRAAKSPSSIPRPPPLYEVFSVILPKNYRAKNHQTHPRRNHRCVCRSVDRTAHRGPSHCGPIDWPRGAEPQAIDWRGKCLRRIHRRQGVRAVWSLECPGEKLLLARARHQSKHWQIERRNTVHPIAPSGEEKALNQRRLHVLHPRWHSLSGTLIPRFSRHPRGPKEGKRRRHHQKQLAGAEAKLSGNNIKTSCRRGRQLRTMLKHAKSGSATHVVFYLSFNHVGTRKVTRMKQIAQRYNSYLFIFPIRRGRGKK